MEEEKLNNQSKLPKEGYIIIPNSFFKEWVGVLGDGPTLLYLKLLTYCHKDKDTAWPTLKTLSRHLYKSTKSLTRHHRRLAKVGLIKKVVKSKTVSGNYKRNIYQLTTPDREKNSLPIGKFVPYVGDKTTPNLGTKCPLNNNNKQNQYNNQNVVVVDIKKSKEEGEEKMQLIRQQLMDLDFKESFIGKLLKDYPVEKIEEKLELLLEKKNINSPAGWLIAALKNDFQDEEEEDTPIPDSSIHKGRGLINQARRESAGRINPSPTKNLNSPEQVSCPSTENKKILSREEALKQIRLARKRLAAITPSYQMKGRWQKKKGEKR